MLVRHSPTSQPKQQQPKQQQPKQQQPTCIKKVHTYHDGGWGSQTQSTRAGNHQDGDPKQKRKHKIAAGLLGVFYPRVGGVTTGQNHPPQQKREDRQREHGGGKNAADTVGKMLNGGFGRLCFFHQPHDLCDGRV